MNKIFRLLGFGDLALFMLEPISFKYKNITIGFHAQDSYEEQEDGSFLNIHTMIFGFLLFRITLEFVTDGDQQ